MLLNALHVLESSRMEKVGENMEIIQITTIMKQFMPICFEEIRSIKTLTQWWRLFPKQFTCSTQDIFSIGLNQRKTLKILRHFVFALQCFYSRYLKTFCNFHRGDVKSKLHYEKMSRQFSRRKFKDRPKLPKGCEEIKKQFEDADVLRKYGYTLDKKSAFYVDTIVKSKYSFCLFKSEAVIEFIKKRIKQRRYLLDGTFKTAAKPFVQILSISVEYKRKVSFFSFFNE